MSTEHKPEAGAESGAGWEALDNCIEGLLFDDLASLRYGANRIADIASPCADDFEAYVSEYEDIYGETESLERRVEKLLNNGVPIEGIHEYYELSSTVEARRLVVEDIMVSGLRTFVYADTDTYRGLNPRVNNNIFYLAASTAGQQLKGAGSWIVKALYPDKKLLQRIEQLEGIPLSDHEVELDRYRGIYVLNELGLTTPSMREELKVLSKSLYQT